MENTMLGLSSLDKTHLDRIYNFLGVPHLKIRLLYTFHNLMILIAVDVFLAYMGNRMLNQNPVECNQLGKYYNLVSRFFLIRCPSSLAGNPDNLAPPGSIQCGHSIDPVNKQHIRVLAV